MAIVFGTAAEMSHRSSADSGVVRFAVSAKKTVKMARSCSDLAPSTRSAEGDTIAANGQVDQQHRTTSSSSRSSTSSTHNLALIGLCRFCKRECLCQCCSECNHTLYAPASKPRVSNITFSTVTSATGLPTIAAEPSRPRSSSYWKPNSYGRGEISGPTPPLNAPFPAKSSFGDDGDAEVEYHQTISGAGKSSSAFQSGEKRARGAGSSAAAGRSGTYSTGKKYGVNGRFSVDATTFELNEDTTSEASSSGESDSLVHTTQGFTFDRCDLDNDPMLARISEWGLPIFEISERYKYSILSRLTYTVFAKSDLFRIFKISYVKFFNFFHSLERGYWDIPYHNRIHAADVLHAVYYLTCHPVTAFGARPSSPSEASASRDTPRVPFSQHMSNLELMALFTAAAMHDYDHPGRTNAFLVAAEDPKAILYNDRSVLENHHAAESWKLLQKPENFFIETLDSDEMKRFRFLVLEHILATDLKLHFDLIMQFTEKTAEMNLTDEGDKLLIGQMLIKFADINSPSKPYPLHKQWTKRIVAEFFEQGDDERKRGITVSPFMNRDDPCIPKLQDSFIAHMVNPLAIALHEAGLLPILPGLSEPELLINLKHNHQKWLMQLDPEERAQQQQQKQQTSGGEPSQSSEPRLNGSMNTRTMSGTVIEEESDSLLGSTSTTSDRKCDSDADLRESLAELELHEPSGEQHEHRSHLE
uniref:Phosphodiesterase n=1 Tax=Steinernema glaseri TaxID=37863 RepID=A0A1I7Z0K2_9BILA